MKKKEGGGKKEEFVVKLTLETLGAIVLGEVRLTGAVPELALTPGYAGLAVLVPVALVAQLEARKIRLSQGSG